VASRFRNISGEDLYVNAPASHPDAHLVEAGEVLRVPGDYTEISDAYVVGKGDSARAYPKSLWKAVEADQKAAATSKKEGE
jgi:hypothetical protein